MRWLWWVVGVLLVIGVAFALIDVTAVDLPNGFTCLPYNPGSPLIEVTADSTRAKGIIIERQFGCTFYFYETPGAD